MGLTHRFGFVVALVAGLTTSHIAHASECTMAQVLADASSVIDPCTTLLNGPTLSKDRRADALLIRGRGYHRSKRIDRAADDYAAAAKLTPKNEEIWMSWANVDLRLGNGEGYADKVERAARLAPTNPRVLRTIGAMYSNFGNRDKAIAFYTKAIQADPNEAFARLFRSQAYSALGRSAEAIADADALVALPREIINRDGHLDADGDVRDFVTVALIHRAELFKAAGQDDRAAQDHEAAVANGRSAPALLARARFFLLKPGVSPGTIADLEEATRTEPTNAWAQNALGMALTRAKQYEPAFAAFGRAIDARPGFAIALRMRALMHRQFGRTDEAVDDFVAAIQADPDIVTASLPALRNAGYWTSAEDPDDFTPEFEDAIRACMLDTTCN